MIVAGLVVLAVVASLLLIFSESVQLLRVGLVVALWAATLGAIAMTKYRVSPRSTRPRFATAEGVRTAARARDHRTPRIRTRCRGAGSRRTGRRGETIAALREELAALRKNLEVLFDGRLPEDRVALRAESMRVQEIAGGYQPAASGLFVPGAEKPARNDNQPPAPRGPSFATRTTSR
ncbi:hypothetical protein GS931_10345 [Rhodococcus hoagii]|nr:hypothetical protein [Prescottella equi]